MKKILIIDHHDSFTYNLQYYCKKLGTQVEVLRCDDPKLGDIQAKTTSFTHIILSPGPGSVYKKGDIGQSAIILQNMTGHRPILGVCLGHQLIAQQFGAQITYTTPCHGEKEPIEILDHRGLFQGLDDTIEGMRYHSMIVDKEDAILLQNSGFTLSASSKSDHQIMALEHHQKKLYGIQFHPESIGTPQGIKILENFLSCS